MAEKIEYIYCNTRENGLTGTLCDYLITSKNKDKVFFGTDITKDLMSMHGFIEQLGSFIIAVNPETRTAIGACWLTNIASKSADFHFCIEDNTAKTFVKDFDNLLKVYKEKDGVSIFKGWTPRAFTGVSKLARMLKFKKICDIENYYNNINNSDDLAVTLRIKEI